MAAPCPLLGDAITDDTLLHIARFLPSSKDLLNLGLTCPRFAAKIIAASSGAEGAAAAAAETLSIVVEAARRWLARLDEQERGWVPRRDHESWLGLMYELELLRLPLSFGRRTPTRIALSHNGAVATRQRVPPSVHDPYGSSTWCTAASRTVMRSGRHFAQFTAVQGADMMFGVIRPGWQPETRLGSEAPWDEGNCLYGTYEGTRYPGHKGQRMEGHAEREGRGHSHWAFA